MTRSGRKPKGRRKNDRGPGALYREIIVQRQLIDDEKDELFTKGEPRYVKLCKRLHEIAPSLGAGSKWPEEYKDAIAFLNWDVSAEQFNAASKFILLISLMVSVILAVVVLQAPGLSDLIYGVLSEFAAIAVFGTFVSLSFIVWWYFTRYPFSVVYMEQRKALGHVPELIGYIVMSMKLSPNLEKASEFAAEHGRGKIAQDFKKLMWNVELGIYNTISEGLDEIAYNWGKYSSEFKRAMMRIRASVLENSEAKRDMVLNKTMEDLLAEIREKMETYARDLKQPSIVLFYIGVLLPIILIIILPIGSAFSGAPFATAWGLFSIYNVLIPVIAFLYARNIIKHRPPTYDVPKIPDSYPGLPPKWKIKLRNSEMDARFVVLAILVVGGGLTWFLHTEGFPPKALLEAMGMEETEPFLPPDRDKCAVIEATYGTCTWFDPDSEGEEMSMIRRGNERASEKQLLAELNIRYSKYMIQPGNDITPYNVLFGSLFTISAAIFVGLYYTTIYKRRVQEKLMQIESEFKDSLYIIASRLGENKPLEDAIKHAKNFLPNYIISDRIFGRTLDNIHLLGMPIDSAVFDPRFGSLVNIPSNTIRVGMRLMIDAVSLGVNIAARTLVSLSLQLDNQEKVSKMLKNMVIDLTQMMRTMAIIITPLVLGITTSLYTVVLRTLTRISTSETMSGVQGSMGKGDMGALGGFSTSSMAQPEAVAQMVGPDLFILIIAVYVAQIVCIVIYFTTKIEEDNDLLMKLYLSKYLPVALIMFTISVMLSNLMLNMFAVSAG